MIEEQEATSLVDSILLSVRGYVDKIAADVRAYVDERVKAIPAGPQGERGVQGDRGEQGLPGLQGIPGTQGLQGALGPIGERGLQGERGESGQAGVQGERGLQGEKGIDGTVGPRGLQGEAGQRGEKGLDGITGPQGIQGLRGDRGEPGPRGDRGEIGLKGDIGLPGRDALEMECLPSIDETKTYPRGTWAQYKGGIARFNGSSWNMMIAAPEQPRSIARREKVASSNPRVVMFKFTYTDGTIEYDEHHFIGMQLFKGVYAEAQAYEQGDTVTHGGSQWVCMVETTKETPGASHDWQLSVKRGKDGKSIQGPQGEPGPAGRDLRYQ